MLEDFNDNESQPQQIPLLKLPKVSGPRERAILKVSGLDGREITIARN
jgi:hypothetical protein